MDVLPQTVQRAIELMNTFVVENEKDARKFIKSICPEKVQASLKLSSLNKRTEKSEHFAMIKPCLNGENIGLMSEAGCTFSGQMLLMNFRASFSFSTTKVSINSIALWTV